MGKKVFNTFRSQDGVALIFVIFILIVIGALGAALRYTYIEQGKSASITQPYGPRGASTPGTNPTCDAPNTMVNGVCTAPTPTATTPCAAPNTMVSGVCTAPATCTNSDGANISDKDHGVTRVHNKEHDNDHGQTWGNNSHWDGDSRNAGYVRFDRPALPNSCGSFSDRTDHDGDHHKGDRDDDANFQHNPFSTYGNLTVSSNAVVAFDGPTNANGQCLGMGHFLTVYVNGDLTVNQGATITTTCNVRFVVTGNTNFYNQTALTISSGTVLLITGCLDAGGNRTCANSNNNSNNNTSYLNASGDASNLMVITTGNFNLGDNDNFKGGVYSNGTASSGNSAITGSLVGVSNRSDGNDWHGHHDGDGHSPDNGDYHGFKHDHSAGSRAWANTSSCTPPPSCSHTRTGDTNDGGHGNNGNHFAFGDWNGNNGNHDNNGNNDNNNNDNNGHHD